MMRIILTVLSYCLVSSCDFISNDEVEDKEPLVKVYEEILYKEDIPKKMSISEGVVVDSNQYIKKYIDQWVTKKLIYNAAQNSLPSSQLTEIDNLVDKYREDLILTHYQSYFINNSKNKMDTLITMEQMRKFHEENKENFRVNEDIYQVQYAVFPRVSTDRSVVRKIKRHFSKKSLSKEDEKEYRELLNTHAADFNYKDNTWYNLGYLFGKISELRKYESSINKLDRTIEISTSKVVYLFRTTAHKETGDYSPLSYVSDIVRKIIINQRKQKALDNLKNELYKQAIRSQQFKEY